MRQEDIAALSVGQRDALLYALRDLMVGPRLEVFAECPACRAPLEFSLETADILARAAAAPAGEVALAADGYTVRFRLPNSFDLAMVVNADVTDGRRELLRRCVTGAGREGHELDGDALPEAVVAAVAAKMQECDPLAEVSLDLACPACGTRRPLVLDIVSFFWTELEVQAKHLLRQVHILARSYGWREEDILAMSAYRRRLYLEMVVS